jgi:broad specificity phosphatase PhoE
MSTSGEHLMEQSRTREIQRQFLGRPDLPGLHGTTRVFLIRHGVCDTKANGEIYGQLDPPLTEDGVKHSDRLVYQLRSLALRTIYSSDLARARYMSDQLVRLFGAARLKEERLRERHYGDWQGKNWADIPEAEIAAYKADNSIAPPGGESMAQVGERVFPLMEEIVRRHIGEEIVVVTHSGVIRAIVGRALGLPAAKLFSFQVKHCSVTVIDYRDAIEKGSSHPYVALLNG